MAVTNLTNTTWRVISTWGAISGYGIFNVDCSYRIIDVNGDKQAGVSGCRGFWVGYNGNKAPSIHTICFDKNDYYNYTHYASETCFSNYCTLLITITGGADVTNAKLINWLETFGKLQTISDLSGTTWEIPSGWLTEKGYGQFNLSAVVNGITLYNGNNFNVGYQKNNLVGNSITIYDAVGEEYVSISTQTKIELQIFGGADATNERLICWLFGYGELVTEQPEEPEEPDQPTTPTKKFTRLFLGAIAHTSNGKRFRKLQDTEYVEETYTLSGKWVFNDTITQYEWDGYGRSWGNAQGFISNGVTYYHIGTAPKGYIMNEYSSLYYSSSLGNYNPITVQKSTTGWVNDNYKTIEFNGTWVVDKEFYDWFTANATEYVEPSLPVWNGTDLTGTTWEVPSGWSATARYGVFYIDYELNGVLRSSEGFAIGYSSYTNRDSVSASNYVCPCWESGISNSNSLTIHIYGDTSINNDTTNTKLIDWLKQYGTLTSHTMPISFTIDGTTYQATEGMTWAEWVDSEYNTDGYMHNGVVPSATGYVNDMSDATVLTNGAVYTSTPYDFGI